MIASSVPASGSWAYLAGVAVALVASLLIVWTTIIRDDGNGIGFFIVIMAAGVGSFAALFRPIGMARTMLGVTIMQALLGIAFATAPIVATTPNGSVRALVYSGFFTAFWLASAGCFRAAAKANIAP